MNSLKRRIAKVLCNLTSPGIVYFNHGIVKEIHDPFIQHLHYKASDFEDFLKFWMDLGFEFISMAQLLEISKTQFKYPKPWIHLTFDDGYLNNKTVLLPLIEKYNIPITIFVSTRQIQEQDRFDTYKIKCALRFTKTAITTYELGLQDIENQIVSPSDKHQIQFVINTYKYLSSAQKRVFFDAIHSLISADEWAHYNALFQSDQPLLVSDLAELSVHPLVHIGSHGVNHYLFSTLTAEEMRFEFEASKKWLEERCKKEITTFCYPNGTNKDFSSLSKKLCMEAGYKLAFTTVAGFPGRKTKLMEVPRIFMVPNNPDKDLKLIFKRALKLAFH
jgi:peptidoglycan/xylan/chitin deacetylase (PgdA/CDA1 family)